MERISILEKEVLELKTIVDKVASKQDIADAPAQSKNTPSDGEAVVSKHKVKLYGFVKVDGTFDDSKTNNPDAAAYASQESLAGEEQQFGLTAMNSRLGMDYSGTKIADGDLTGKVEMDFYDTASDTSQQLRMRHAFVEVKYPKWALLAGQTSDLFSPLGPTTLNTNGYLLNGGNPGLRRPQVRLTNFFDLNNGKKITTAISANRNIGIGNGSVNTGENSGAPVVQLMAAYTFPLFGKSSTVGVSGFYGQEKYNRNDNVTASHYMVPQYGYSLDILMPVNKWLEFKGEVFTGSNLDSFFGGIGQGINTALEDGVDSTGGWVQASIKPWEKGTFNIGYAIDDVNEDSINVSNLSKNEIAFINFVYALCKSIDIGLEYAHYDTSYKGQANGDNNRVTISVIYKF